jgi:hypothetical protein
VNRSAFAAAAFLAIAVPRALAGDAPAQEPACCADLQVSYMEKSVTAKTAEDRVAVALWCREKGLLPESTAQFREAARLDPENAAAREALGDKRVEGRWVTSDDAMARKGLVRHEGRWVLPEEKAILGATAEEKARAAREEDRARRLIETMASGGEAQARMAREALAGVEDRFQVAPLAFALRARNKAVRLHAASELGRIRDRRALKALVARALRDPEADVRTACVDAAKAFGDPELLAPFFRSFVSAGSAEVRAAAADAIGRTGDLRGISILVYSMEAHGGGPRGHIYTATQMTFVQDFDVEVAQTAFIADPQIGVLQDGASLDVKCVSNEWYKTGIERQAIVGALRNLTGAKIGDDAAAWKTWLAANREKLVAAK